MLVKHEKIEKLILIPQLMEKYGVKHFWTLFLFSPSFQGELVSLQWRQTQLFFFPFLVNVYCQRKGFSLDSWNEWNKLQRRAYSPKKKKERKMFRLTITVFWYSEGIFENTPAPFTNAYCHGFSMTRDKLSRWQCTLNKTLNKDLTIKVFEGNSSAIFVNSFSSYCQSLFGLCSSRYDWLLSCEPGIQLRFDHYGKFSIPLVRKP